MLSQHNFPLFLDLVGRRVLVVGAGPVGTRRAMALCAAGAQVRVISPVASEALTAAAAQELLVWKSREFVVSDLDGVWFAVTATGISEVDDHVSSQAEARRIWCVNAASGAVGSAVTPSVATGPDGIAVAVSGGGDPGRSLAITEAITLGLAVGSLPVRRLRAQVQRDEPLVPGRVTLVGGGPGDPGLVTVNGLAAVSEADVLVVDRLAPQALWATPGEGVEVIDVGKAPGRHAASQAEINAVLITKAKEGKRVVRIKGGDSFILGRGGEEALACIEADVEVNVIPGITSAISVPAAVGIPLTHRSITSSFTVASAHDGPEGVLAVAGPASEGSTLVLLMGAGRLPEIAAALVASGRDPRTPLAVIESGWTPDQKTTVSTLGQTAGGAVVAHPPAVVVIGDVVDLRSVLGDLGTPSSAFVTP